MRTFVSSSRCAHRERLAPRGLMCALVGAALAAPLALAPRQAGAQGPQVDPSGTPAEAPTPPPTPTQPAAPTTVLIPVDPRTGQVQAGPQAPAPVNPDGFYHYDAGLGDAGLTADEPVVIHSGPTPELHVVRSGDTLWDICFYYFNDPWQWPKIWSYNAQITNPHWIYPGDLVRMMPRGVFVGASASFAADDREPAAVPAAPADPRPAPARRVEVSLRQTAFVEQDELDQSIKIDGSVEEKVLLAAGDDVYLTYPASKPPRVGKRYSVYVEGGSVSSGGSKVGAYVRLLGTIEVISVKKDKRARARILTASEEIERGAKVGPLLTTFKSVPPVAPTVDAQGAIVAMLGADQLIGSGELVFLDIGSKSGVQVGNRLTVVRRGDAYDSSRGTSTGVGQDDRRFPARALGEVVVVELGKKISVALVTLAVQEFGVGDLVMMQKRETK